MENRCYGCMKVKTQRVCEHCGYDEYTRNQPHQLASGTVLQGRYLIGRVLGQGGFGITYLGWDNYLDVPVAIKEYFPSGLVVREAGQTVSCVEGGYRDLYAGNRERFFREAKTLAKLADVPQVVHVLNLFMDNNTAYIVMEYIQGVTMKDYVQSRGGRISLQQTLTILGPVMQVLEKVHAAGIVHRDISPDNIMMLPDGSAKLLDFGAVREVENPGVEKALTKSTEAILKHGFAPIEQYQTRGGLGPWTDVYALCGTIYYCLTGRVPVDAPRRVMGEEGTPWTAIPGLTAQQAAVLEKGMNLAPKGRIGSVKELREGLMAQPVRGYAPTVPVIPAQPEVRYPEGTIPLVREQELYTAPVSRVEPKQELYTAPVSRVEPKQEPYTAPVSRVEPKRETHTVPLSRDEKVEEAPVAPAKHAENENQWEQYQAEKEENEKRKKKIIVLSAFVALGLAMFIFFVCYFAQMAQTKNASHAHSWTKATCSSPATCTICGKTVGEPAAHTWTAATCETPATCTVCGATGKALGHDLQLADCEHPNTCKLCGLTLGVPAGHKWAEATSENPRTCTVCGKTDGEALGHRWQDNVLANRLADYSLNEEKDSAFSTKYIRSAIHYITFLDSVSDAPADAKDASESYNGSVLTWVEIENGEYHLYIAGEGGVAAPENSKRLFGFFENVKEINFNGCFHTDNVTNMSLMFVNCFYLESLDISSFDTSGVTDMEGMFHTCVLLSKLDISNFDTSNVTDMSWMFCNCMNLTEIRVGEFNTSKVKSYDSFMDSGKTFNGRPWEELFE